VVDAPYNELLHGLRHSELDLLIGALRDPVPVDDVVQEPLIADQPPVGGLVETSSIVLICSLLLESDRLTLISRHQILREQAQGLLVTLPYDMSRTLRPIGLTTRRNCGRRRRRAGFWSWCGRQRGRGEVQIIASHSIGAGRMPYALEVFRGRGHTPLRSKSQPSRHGSEQWFNGADLIGTFSQRIRSSASSPPSGWLHTYLIALVTPCDCPSVLPSPQ
jgi:hypothetical protein